VIIGSGVDQVANDLFGTPFAGLSADAGVCFGYLTQFGPGIDDATFKVIQEGV
jgi:hypothetical protein